MRFLGWHLITLLALLGLAAGFAHVPLETSPRATPKLLANFPAVIGEWDGSPGAPTDILPDDPRARGTGRWRYRNGDRVVWVAVAFYDSRNNELSRPSINHIAPERGVSGLRWMVLPISVNGPDKPAISVNQTFAKMSDTRIEMLFWYQLGSEALANQYRFRLKSFLNTLLGREESLMLVRVATVFGPEQESAEPSIGEQFLRSFYPALMKALATDRNEAVRPPGSGRRPLAYDPWLTAHG